MYYNYYSLNNDFVNFTIGIEISLYRKENKKFNILFMNFECDSVPHSNNCYYVKEYQSGISGILDEVIYINLDNPKWLYYLFAHIEEIMMKHLAPRTICLHGSGIFLDQGAIIFIGKRNIGKSTIIKKLLKTTLYSYLDDDLIMVKDDLVWGPGLPIKSRSCDSTCIMECDDETRYLSNYKRTTNSPQNIILIVYPTYNERRHNSIEVLSSKQNFRYLYENIKHGDISLSIKTIVEMSMRCRSCRLIYSDDEFLYSLIKKQLREI